jgi:hypothetical protein
MELYLYNTIHLLVLLTMCSPLSLTADEDTNVIFWKQIMEQISAYTFGKPLTILPPKMLSSLHHNYIVQHLTLIWF